MCVFVVGDVGPSEEPQSCLAAACSLGEEEHWPLPSSGSPASALE